MANRAEPTCQDHPNELPLPPRKRVMRTYGKRKSPAESTEAPLTKRRAISEDTLVTEEPRPENNPALSVQPVSQVPPRIASEEAVRSGIMKFFKPLPKLPKVAPSESSSDTTFPASTPPSSPPPVYQHRTRRRLTTRRLGSEERLEDSTGASDRNKENRPPENSRKWVGVNDQGEEGYREDKHPDTCRRQDAAPKRRSSTPSVQTTLSLTTEAAFVECKVCGMLYNHLHPQDVKLHARQHAAVLRKKAI